MSSNVELIREVLSKIPDQPMNPGRPINFGTPGNKDNARALAAQLGHVFDPNCSMCDYDLYIVLRYAVK